MQQIESLKEEAQRSPTVENYRALLQARVAYLKAEEQRAEAHRAKTQGEKEKQEHQMLWLKVQKKCAQRSTALQFYMKGTYNSPEGYLKLVGSWLDSWSEFFGEIQSEITKLKIYTTNHPDALPSLKILFDDVDTMCRQQLQARSFIGYERRALALRSEASIQVLQDHTDSLQQWLMNAEQRQKSLFTLRDCDGFLSYLSRNQSRVESGLLALSSEYEVLMPTGNKALEDGLISCYQLWSDITLSLYERLHDEVMACHEELEVPEHCANFLKDEAAIDRLLSHLKIRLREPGREKLLEECDSLLGTHRMLSLLAGHIYDFKSRDAVVYRAFSCLAKAVRSPLTYFLLHLPVYEDYEGRKEHHQRLQELQEWIEVKSQKKTFMNLLERTNVVREMLRDFETTLKVEKRGTIPTQ